MGRTIVLAGALGLVLSVANDARGEPPAEWGGFGYGTVGGLVGGWSNLEADLEAPDAFGPGAELSPLALQVGGGGRVLLADRFLLGGKGMAWFMNGDRRGNAVASLLGGGGGFDFGYAAFNGDHMLVYPYIGVGGYTMSVDVGIGPERVRPFSFGSGAVAPGASETFSAAFFATDFGLGIQQMLPVDGGALVVGFEGGLLVPVVEGSWTDDDGVEIEGVNDYGVSGAYLRLTIGGGVFEFSDDPRYQRPPPEYADDPDADPDATIYTDQ